ncbi:MAG: hypothetical protein K2P58_12250 [Hyphomonadaceae bacterium]|nr:hypothetical protein [Hyphomonadaceae bacterium]
MTLQGEARAKALWAAGVVATFVLFGGLIGGLVIGLGIPLIAMAAQWPASSESVLLLPGLGALAGAYGIIIGLPASLLTSAAYLIGRGTMRRRWRLTAFGAMTSALWGAALAEVTSQSSASPATYATMAAMFAVCGALATIVCFSLIKPFGGSR